MRVLMIDNYDSFTYNLVQYLQELGAEVLVHRNDKIDLAGMEALNADRLMISPGPCTPNEAGISVDAIKHFAGKMPILGSERSCFFAQLSIHGSQPVSSGFVTVDSQYTSTFCV